MDSLDFEVRAEFSTKGAANAAATALGDVGVSVDQLAIEDESYGAVPAREARYIVRLVIIIVVWSVIGGGIGAPIGVALALTVGPEGTTGLILQVVSWAIMGHLIVGMLAGYIVLADRTSREMEPTRARTSLTARVSSREEAEQMERILRSSGADQIRTVVPRDMR